VRQLWDGYATVAPNGLLWLATKSLPFDWKRGMPLSLDELVQRIRDKQFGFPPAAHDEVCRAKRRGVPNGLLDFYVLCDGAYIGQGDDCSAPDGRRYRFEIPRLCDIQTVQSYGFISVGAPLYAQSAQWWQIVDYGDGNWLAFDGAPATNGRIIDIFHETVGDPVYHGIVAASLNDLLERLLTCEGVYWLADGFESLGQI